MSARKSHIFLVAVGVGAMLLGGMLIHATNRQEADAHETGERRRIVRQLGLSDLCLFTDARYTRHPSMADPNTAFQDYPLSLEHFPSGSILSLPPHLQKSIQP